MLLDLGGVGVGVGDGEDPRDVVLGTAVGAARAHAGSEMFGHLFLMVTAFVIVLLGGGRRCRR